MLCKLCPKNKLANTKANVAPEETPKISGLANGL
ncbi:Uncharacterised protein [Vibrio cholerae]|nr:Uncharacterised protein [Vibrio cholerae]CSI56870.1 Uncharacterised protein [Vibrio cholerae]